MKLNLLAGITLLVIGNSISGVEAQTTINQSNYQSSCGWVKDCAIAVNKKETVKEVTKSVTPSTSLEEVESTTQSSEQLSEQLPQQLSEQLPNGKGSTVAALTATSQRSASILKSSGNSISQLTTPTDSNGNPLFRATRSGPSYLGVGANFGVTGGSDLGGTSLAIISKFGLTDVISARPSVLILRNFATILLPVTYEFAPQQLISDFQFSPYLGGGLAINTGSNSSVGVLVTGGVDIPLSSRFTINVAANLAFLRTTDLGILVGIGYNF